MSTELVVDLLAVPEGHKRYTCDCTSCVLVRRERRRLLQREYRARMKRTEPPLHVHGTVNGYSNYGCRCDLCALAWSAHMKLDRQRRKMQGPPVHGTKSGTKDYGCRCDECVPVRNAVTRVERAAKRAKAS